MNGHKGFLTPRRLLVVALAILSVGIIVTVRYINASGSHAGYEYERGRDDTINVAIAYSPMSLYRYGDTLAGFNYEMLRGMSAMYGDKVKYYPVSSVSESLDRLSDGVYDVLIADIPVTASLRQRFRFSEPVYIDRMVLVSRDTTVTTPLALAGKQVWVVAGSPAAERVGNLSREIGDSIVIHDSHKYSAEQLVMLVSAGDIPMAVVNEEVAHRLHEEYSDLHVDTKVSFSQFQSWIFNKRRTALADTLDAQIERFKLTPQYKELLDKWLDCE